MRVQHIIQTRFSVRTQWGHMDGFPSDWLAARLDLFDAYCYPSVAAQTTSNFQWLIYCDEATPASTMEHLRDRARALPQMQLVVTGPTSVRTATKLLVDNEADVLITTRLDSDDAIHARYAEAIQARASDFVGSRRESWLLNFPRGFTLDRATGILYFAWSPRSHFHSLFERDPAATSTVLAGNHSNFHEQHPTDQDDSLAAWVQVIHGGNVKNSLREGVWVPEAKRARLHGFGIG